MSAEEEFEKTAQEMDTQKTDVIEGLAAGETLEMPEAVDTEVAAIEAQADPETAQSVPEATEATQTGPEAAEDEDEEYEKKKAPLPFWTRGKVAAVGGIAAALVVGVVGIAAISLPQADATSDAPASDVGPAAEATANVAQAKADPAQPNAVPEGETAAAGENAAAPDGATKANESTSAASSAGGSKASDKPSGGTTSSSSTTPKSESKPAASEPKKEQHVHSWEPVYKDQWVSKMVTVTDQAAYDEPVYKYVEVCACGEEFSSGSEAAAHAMAQESGRHNSHTEKRKVDTIHHDAVTHQEDQGHYEQVKTGEKCSSCGATK